MNDKRVRIVDIAEALGLSTATVSNVIHGKTKKISDETVKRVQELLEEKQYIPSMAGILLAQNDSRIIGVVINNHEKYEGRVLEDGFIASCLNSLSEEIDRNGYFMMVKTTREWNEIPRFASMWNMDGLVLIGFCDSDYKKLRENMHIPFVIYDGFLDEQGKMANIVVDSRSGGELVGRYLIGKGHQSVLCISDNDVCTDLERYQGLKKILPKAELMIIPMQKEEREDFYLSHLEMIRKFSAIFAVSDYYAVDMMNFLKSQQIQIPEDISIVGFDDTELGKMVQPALTTIRQDSHERAREALKMLAKLKHGQNCGDTIKIKVSLVERASVKAII
ncbi:MAG: LacI family DNA-binding transcriptional regulator [Eubacteriales bacterium]|nr:LacI family DNA-binding transcriptional regulator [Eubacteriales bacterium]